MNITEKLKMLPDSPGVYRFLDEEGNVIYVGKAKNLKNRVSQYFQSDTGKNRKTIVMVSKIHDIIHTVVDSESDAFLLENNLIKQFQPKYNILLKDGKTYPWIVVRNEPFPRIMLTRRFRKDGSRYFGPYTSVVHAHRLLDLLSTLYKLRTCKHALTEASVSSGKFKVCLDYHIHRCAAPCVGLMTSREYEEQITSAIQILKGNSYSLIKEFERNMKKAASLLRFEEAQLWKERKELLEAHYSKSLIVNSANVNIDVCSILYEGDIAFGNFMRISNGCIVQSLSLEIRMRIEEDEASVMASFLNDLYDRLAQYGSPDRSRELLVSSLPDGIEELFPDISFTLPVKGDRAALLELSRKNAAALKFEKLKAEEIANPQEHSCRVMENLMKDLGMKELPRHIECFDNSNIQGTNPVASCVVFRDGVPSKKDYRHFNIKTVIGANDFASMKEVVNRRYSRLLAEGESLPQLVVVDGGKGQVASAFEALDELGLLGKIKLIGIAKRMEELIVPGDPYPLFIDKNSTSLKLIMSMRDEAHRFGITHHRNRRSRTQIESELDTIPGVGAVSRERLAAKYKTVSRIKSVPYREMVNVIGKRSADALFDYFGLYKG